VDWDGRAQTVLDLLCRMVPETLRPIAEAAAREESEMVAAERGAAEVGDADVIHGWIRVTPPEQRNSLVAIIENLGYDPAEFADQLEDAEEWNDEVDDDGRD